MLKYVKRFVFIFRFGPQFYQHCNGCDVDNSKPVGCCMVTALSVLVNGSSRSSWVHRSILTASIKNKNVYEKCELLWKWKTGNTGASLMWEALPACSRNVSDPVTPSHSRFSYPSLRCLCWLWCVLMLVVFRGTLGGVVPYKCSFSPSVGNGSTEQPYLYGV